MKKPRAPRKPKEPREEVSIREINLGPLCNHDTLELKLNYLENVFENISNQYECDLNDISIRIKLEVDPDDYGYVENNSSLDVVVYHKKPVDKKIMDKYNVDMKKYDIEYKAYQKEFKKYKEWKKEQDRLEKINELKKELAKLEGRNE